MPVDEVKANDQETVDISFPAVGIGPLGTVVHCISTKAVDQLFNAELNQDAYDEDGSITRVGREHSVVAY